MSKQTKNTDYPLTIEVKKSFPLRRIKEITVELPDDKLYGYKAIKLNKEEATYLKNALQQILEPDEIPPAKATDIPPLAVGLDS